MQARTKELLYLLQWTCETLSRPTWRNLTESFEGWAYRRGLLRQLQRLERQAFLERSSSASGDRLYRLTDAGRLEALHGRDPEASWQRRWDGRWRMVLFDVPESQRVARNRLRHYLRSRGFGYLQNSVWITPHPLDGERSILVDGPVNVSSLILLEAFPCSGESDTDIVAAAWDFDEINRRYAKHLQVLDRRPHGRLDTEVAARMFLRWLCEERESWQEVTERDPFLPAGLLPAGLLPQNYAGRRTWQQRQKIMAEMGERMRKFKAG